MEFTAYDIAIIPLIIALVGLIVKMGFPRKYAPVVALALGIAAGFFYLAPGEPKKAVLYGIVVGLSAVGLYSGVKNVGQGIAEGSGS
jgi:L-lactate permease